MGFNRINDTTRIHHQGAISSFSSSIIALGGIAAGTLVETFDGINWNNSIVPPIPRNYFELTGFTTLSIANSLYVFGKNL